MRRKSQRARFATVQNSSNFLIAAPGSGTWIISGSFGGSFTNVARIWSGVPSVAIEATQSSISFDLPVAGIPFVFWQNWMSGMIFSSDDATIGF